MRNGVGISVVNRREARKLGLLTVYSSSYSAISDQLSTFSLKAFFVSADDCVLTAIYSSLPLSCVFAKTWWAKRNTCVQNTHMCGQEFSRSPRSSGKVFSG
jgi:hypothetical protein